MSGRFWRHFWVDNFLFYIYNKHSLIAHTLKKVTEFTVRSLKQYGKSQDSHQCEVQAQMGMVCKCRQSLLVDLSLFWCFVHNIPCRFLKLSCLLHLQQIVLWQGSTFQSVGVWCHLGPFFLCSFGEVANSCDVDFAWVWEICCSVDGDWQTPCWYSE